MMIETANTVLLADNQGALKDPKVHVVIDDAFSWVRAGGDGQRYDAIIVDLPDPDTEIVGRLYTEEFYAMLLKQLVYHTGCVFPNLFNVAGGRVSHGGAISCACSHVWGLGI